MSTNLSLALAATLLIGLPAAATDRTTTAPISKKEIAPSKPSPQRPPTARPKAKPDTLQPLSPQRAAAIALPQRRFKKIPGVEIEPVGAAGNPKLYYRGIEAQSIGDADGTDETAVWVALVRIRKGAYEKEVYHINAGEPVHLARDGSIALQGATLLTPTTPTTPLSTLLVSAVIEIDDNDNSAQEFMAALDAMLEDSIVAAKVLGTEDKDPLDTLHAMVILARNMFGASADRPSVRTRKIDTWDWDRLYDREPKSFGRGTYKMTMSHEVGDGKYRLLFDVPRRQGHLPRRLVRVDIDDVRVLKDPGDLDGKTEVNVCIGAIPGGGLGCHTFYAYSNLLNPGEWKPTSVYRWVRQYKTTVTINVHQQRIHKPIFTGYSDFDLAPGTIIKSSVSKEIDPTLSPIELHYIHEGDDENYRGRIDFRIRY